MEILKTKNYKMFKPVGGNRVLNARHLAKLTASVAQNNLLAYFPILVNEKHEIIDGQHRFEVAKNNNLEVYYIVAPKLSLQDARLLNANIKPWTMQDYLDSYAQQGFKDYMILKKFVEENDLPISTALMILTKTLNRQYAGTLRNEFKNGTFKATEIEYAEELMNKLSDMKDRVQPKLWRDRNFMWAFMRVEETADHNKLVDKATRAGWTIERERTLRDYMRSLEDVYNYHNTGTRDRFF